MTAASMRPAATHPNFRVRAEEGGVCTKRQLDRIVDAFPSNQEELRAEQFALGTVERTQADHEAK
jgi:hypothetical protein